MDMNTEQIVWSTAEYKLKFILDNPNFGLPQIVRVVQGYMIDEDDSLASGQILTLHGQKKMEKLTGQDEHGKEVNIPINCPYKVKLISTGNKRYFKTVRDICKCEDKPKVVKNRDVMSTGSGKCYQPGTAIEIVNSLTSADGDSIGLICRTVTGSQETLHLPLDFMASFEECLPPEIESKRYFLWEVVKEYGLPVEVQFPPVTDRNSGYGPHLGSLHIEKISSSDVVMATSVLDGIRYAITFSAELPVTIQVAKGMLDNLTTYEETRQRQQHMVDLKKFDYLSNADPYAPVLFQNEVYDELQTPLPPRRVRISAQQSPTDTLKALQQPPPRNFPKPALRRGKSEDLIRVPTKLKDMKELENFVKQKLNLKNFKVRKDKKNRDTSRECLSAPDESASYRAFVASDDGNSSTGACSIDIVSTGSGGTEPYHRLAECMDATSLDHVIVEHSRRSSSDSGVCLPAKRRNSHRQRSQSRQMIEHDSNILNDKISEWTLPLRMSDQSQRSKTPSISGSINYLWGVMDSVSVSDMNNNPGKKERSLFTNNGIADKDSISDYSPRENFDMSYSSRSDTSSQNDPELHRSPEEARTQASMAEIRVLSEEGVADLLILLKMAEFIELFKENQINGELLITLDVSDFIADLKLSVFQAKKLFKYIRGWRPKAARDSEADQTSRRNSLNPRDWTEDDVMTHMTSINLPDFAIFCKHNQVDGELLLDILDTDTLQALRIEHHVKITNLETKKLTNFVVKGWRPDSSPIKTAPTI